MLEGKKCIWRQIIELARGKKEAVIKDHNAIFVQFGIMSSYQSTHESSVIIKLEDGQLMNVEVNHIKILER